MPRLSIIIAHQRDDTLLEATILSVLENRPTECEVIVVHDGSYSDPYELGDEVVFVEADRGSHMVQLVNAGILAACSPVVHTLVEGVIAQPAWTDAALDILACQEDVAAVAVGIEDAAGRFRLGVDRRAIGQAGSLCSGRVHQRVAGSDCAGPEIAGGFYRRKVLLALGGFEDSVGRTGAEVELAWALNALSLQTNCDSQVRLTTNAPPTKPSSAETSRLARAAIGYGVVDAGAGRIIGELIRGYLSGHPRSTFAWCRGLLAGANSGLATRLNNAKQQLAESAESPELRIFFGGTNSGRRAA